MIFKDEKCFGGKFSKERISLFLTANMSGTEISDDDSTFESCTTSSKARSSLDILRNFIEGCDGNDGITEQEFSADRKSVV